MGMYPLETNRDVRMLKWQKKKKEHAKKEAASHS